MPPTQELTQLDERLKEIKTAFAAKVSENNALSDSFEMAEGVLTIDGEKAKTFRENLTAVKEMRQAIEDLEGQKNLIIWGESPDADPVAVAAAAAVASGMRGKARKSIGVRFTESAEFKAMMDAKQFTMASPFDVEVMDLASLGRLQAKDVYSSIPTGTPGAFGTIERDAMVPMPQRRTRVRDLFPARPTSAAVIEYFRVTGFTNAASVVPERAAGNTGFFTKPQSGLSFKGQQAPVRTIAHWEAAHRNVLQDEPQLQGLIEDELLYGLRLVEDNQILNGTGQDEDLQGILPLAGAGGVQQYSWSSGAVTPQPDNKADAIRRAATLAFLAYYEPTGVVVNDEDWEDIELSKDANGQYLLAVSIAMGGEPRVWRMPVVATPAITAGKALVGSFGIGAQLYDRMQGNIRISEHHADFFIQNAIAVLAEERLALAVKRPESFVVVTFDAEPS